GASGVGRPASDPYIVRSSIMASDCSESVRRERIWCDEIIAPASWAFARGTLALGFRKRTLRLPEERRETSFQARPLRRSRPRSSAGHRPGRDDPPRREIWRPAGPGTAPRVPADPFQRDDGLVPPP